jgi:L-seryl-tRNA(Ser) seleniumtransferase
VSSVFERLGVPLIVNAKGPSTRVSGGIMAAEVAEAMREATQACVDMVALQSAASRTIAEVTGAQAGFVTAGAAAALLVGTAACLTGLDPARMNRLPDTTGMRRRVVMVRSQRNFYDHAVRGAGVELVEVGLADRYAGAGVRDAEAWEIAEAIDERTACVFYVAQPQSRPALHEVVEVARSAGVPVLVDAAAQLPPVANLRRFIEAGADLVAFSGGKAIGGPQGSGILCGRKDLVAAAALQCLDQDLLRGQWTPPLGLFDGFELCGLPQHGIGRPCKVGKEQVVGLLVALRRFARDDFDARHAAWASILEEVARGLEGLPLDAEIRRDSASGEPKLHLAVERRRCGLDALGLVLALHRASPSVQVDPARVDDGLVVIGASCLREGDPGRIVGAFETLLRPA